MLDTCRFFVFCIPDSSTGISSVKRVQFDIHKEQIEFETSDYFKEKSKHRYKIEAKNGELKNAHSYGRAISYGIENMQMQSALTIFTVNLKRILNLN
ncbi:transposase [Flavivirga aquatica]|uniref:transposase n=1 Tax=Flavivirga aquatica TaxID=1849968 RepID=UPI003D7BCF27